MHWYQGSIAEAVAASKKNGAVFVVYVEGKDNKSQKITELIEHEEVSRQLEKEHFVAIKVEENSVPHQQFSQIYKQATVPSMFFIGKTGTPLEIVTEPHSTRDFLSKLQTILQKNGTNITINLPSDTETFIKNEQDQNAGELCEKNGFVSLPPKSKPSTSKEVTENAEVEVSENVDLTPDKKVERAQEILNQKREAKRAEEEQAARAKELERRKVGQDVQKLKRWQQDQELKELMDERNKEKKEKEEARQRVLAQIAQDKAERAAKFAGIVQPNQQPQTSPQPVRRANSKIARLQFKLPDGTSYMHDFPNTDTLQDVRHYIIANLALPFQNFSLSTTFPRREFTVDNSSETLLDLELVPNAVILVFPIQHGAVSTRPDSWLMTIFWSFIGPILNFVGYLRSRLFGSSQQDSTSSPGSHDRKRPIDDAGEATNVPKKRLGEATVVRRSGNVHRLKDNTDSDEDNNTWNGNSTQQM